MLPSERSACGAHRSGAVNRAQCCRVLECGSGPFAADRVDRAGGWIGH